MKFSVCVYACDCESTIRAALDSVFEQTHKDIEVICVDNGSVDTTYEILKEYEGNSRCTVIRHNKRIAKGGAYMSAFRNMTGDYVMFLSGKNSYTPNACAVLQERLQKTPVDIMGYNAVLSYENPIPKWGSDGLEWHINATYGKFTGGEIFKKLYKDHGESLNILCKCYSRSLVQRVMEELTSGFMEEKSVNEFMVYCLLCMLAETYVSVDDSLYKYHLTPSFDEKRFLPVDEALYTVRSTYKAYEWATRVAKEKGIWADSKDLLEDYKKSALNTLMRLMVAQKNEQCNLVFQTLYYEFGLELVIDMARHFWWESNYLAKKLDIGKLLPLTRKEVKTVAMYYHRAYNGRVERVISLMCPTLVDLGYRVILITDEGPNERDFPLPPEIQRVCLHADEKFDKDHYEVLAKKLLKCIETYEIDAVIYHAWMDMTLFWDMFVIKSTGAAFISYIHGVFTTGISEGWTGVQYIEDCYRHMDGICVLSRTDQLFWQRLNPNVFFIQNPFALAEHVPAPKIEKPRNILWLARFGGEKNPVDALRIMRRVVIQRPDAHLTMVGHLEPKDRKYYEGLLRWMKLEKNVSLPGFSDNVQEYYQNADVFLATSNSEGFLLTAVESFANHVPIVAYRLPYHSGEPIDNEVRKAYRGSHYVMHMYNDPFAHSNRLYKNLFHSTIPGKLGLLGKVKHMLYRSITVLKEDGVPGIMSKVENRFFK